VVISPAGAGLLAPAAGWGRSVACRFPVPRGRSGPRV